MQPLQLSAIFVVITEICKIITVALLFSMLLRKQITKIFARGEHHQDRLEAYTKWHERNMRRLIQIGFVGSAGLSIVLLVAYAFSGVFEHFWRFGQTALIGCVFFTYFLWAFPWARLPLK
jgi:hypothetical protein